MTKYLMLFLLVLGYGFAGRYKPIILDPSYDHDRFNTQPKDIVRQFRAYMVSFDGRDDNNGDGTSDHYAVPEWVAYHMKRVSPEDMETHSRPGSWITDKYLHKERVAPNHKSYSYSNAFRAENPDWYVRGHLCMKNHASRLGANADYNTHTMLNAFPQRQSFNAGIWLDLEDMTADWADLYGEVWIITGPVFTNGKPIGWLGEKTEEKDEVLVAIPDSAFKIVIRQGSNDTLDVLAFIYPQQEEGGFKEPYEHEKYLVSVDRIETLTGLNFLTALPDNQENALEAKVADKLWPTDP